MNQKIWMKHWHYGRILQLPPQEQAQAQAQVQAREEQYTVAVQRLVRVWVLLVVVSGLELVPELHVEWA